MKAFIALVLLGWAVAVLAACANDNVPYDGVSSYAGTGFWDSYYGPHSPPRDS